MPRTHLSVAISPTTATLSLFATEINDGLKTRRRLTDIRVPRTNCRADLNFTLAPPIAIDAFETLPLIYYSL